MSERPLPEGRLPGGRLVGGRLAEGLLVGLFVSLPLATSIQELAMALALGAALVSHARGRLFAEPWGRAALAAAVVWVLLVPASGDVREGFGHAWLFAPLLAVPALVAVATGTARSAGVGRGDPVATAVASEVGPGFPLPVAGGAPTASADRGAASRDDAAHALRARVARWGLAAACAGAAWAIGQRLLGAVGTAGMSHHLSLAYGLLPPLGVAVAARRYGASALLAAGVLATGSAGAVVALAATVGGAALRAPRLALVCGVVATLALLPFSDAGELQQRAVLWTGGLSVAADGASGPGAYAAASAPAYDALEPGFWFPNHAHDSAVQLLAVLGPAGLVATLGLCMLLLRRGAPGAAAGLAGVLVGGLTQDVLGDLEVARAAWAWVALMGAMPLCPRSREPLPPDGY